MTRARTILMFAGHHPRCHAMKGTAVLKTARPAAILFVFSASAALAAPTEREVTDLLTAEGIEVTWSDAATDEDMLVVAELALTSDGSVLEATSAAFLSGPGGALLRAELSGATLRAAGEAQTTGRVTARRLQTDDARALGALLRRAEGATRCTRDDPTNRAEIMAEGTTFSAARSLLPTEAVGPERVTVDTLEAALAFGNGDAPCAGFDVLSARGLEALAIDRSTASLDSFEITRSRGADTDFRLALDGFAAASDAGTELMTLGALSGRLALDAAATENLAQIDAVEMGPHLWDMLLAGDAPQAQLTLDMTGLDLPIGMLLPPSLRARADIAPQDRISGAFSFEMASGDNALTLEQQIDLSGLARSDALIDLRTGGSSGNMERMLEGEAQLEFLTGLRLVEAALSFEDDGLNAIVTALAGQSIPDMLADQRDTVVASIPGPLRGGVGVPLDAIIEWSADLFERGGGMRMTPERPVGLFDVAMTSMTRPDDLGSVLGLEVE